MDVRRLCRSQLGLIFLGMAFSLPGSVGLAAQKAQEPHVQVELVSETRSIQPGQTLWVGALFRLEPHWHVYWINAGDSGQAPRIQWKLPQGLEAGDIQWPYPHRMPSGPLMNYGYEKQVLLPVPIQVSGGVSGTAKLNASLRWLVCKDICIPGKASLELELPVDSKTPAKGPHASLFEKTRAELPRELPPEVKLSASEHGSDFQLKWEGILLSHPVFFPLDSEVVDNVAAQKLLRTDSGASILQIKKSEQIAKVPDSLRGVLVSDGKAYKVDAPFPQKPVAQIGTIWGAIVFALLGGLILNLMPCVFPVLSIKALSLLSLQKDSSVRLHGWAYTLGILVSFWVFAALILVFRSGGQALGWGFQLQSPAFIAILAELLFLMSLNLLGVFEISFSATGAGGQWASMPGYAGSFFTGVLATLVATPCTAPFMGTALGFAVSRSAWEAFAIFTAVGLGLALPYLVLSFWPQMARILPRPGRWMESFRQFLAFPLLATVIWLVWIFSLQAGVQSVAILLSSLLLISLGAWIAGRWRRPLAWGVFWLALGVSGVIAAGSGLAGSPEISAQQDTRWQAFSKTALQDALQKRKPVFVDFTAAWCVTCKVNESMALNRDEVVQKMRELGVVSLRGDWTNANPEITEVLSEFGRNGVPLYLLYSGREGEAPRVLPQILTPGTVLGELNAIGESR